MNTSKRRRRKRRWSGRHVTTTYLGLALPGSPLVSLPKCSLCEMLSISIFLLLSFIVIGSINDRTADAAPQPTLGPSQLNMFSKMVASMALSQESSSPNTLSINGEQQAVQQQANSRVPILVRATTSTTNMKSARMATHYHVSCPAVTSIHPCTCVQHTPDTFSDLEGDEEEIYEISPTITPPYAEPLVMTSSSSTTSSPSLSSQQSQASRFSSTTTITGSSSNSTSTSTSTTTTTTTIAPDTGSSTSTLLTSDNYLKITTSSATTTTSEPPDKTRTKLEELNSSTTQIPDLISTPRPNSQGFEGPTTEAYKMTTTEEPLVSNYSNNQNQTLDDTSQPRVTSNFSSQSNNSIQIDSLKEAKQSETWSTPNSDNKWPEGITEDITLTSTPSPALASSLSPTSNPTTEAITTTTSTVSPTTIASQIIDLISINFGISSAGKTDETKTQADTTSTTTTTTTTTGPPTTTLLVSLESASLNLSLTSNDSAVESEKEVGNSSLDSSRSPDNGNMFNPITLTTTTSTPVESASTTATARMVSSQQDSLEPSSTAATSTSTSTSTTTTTTTPTTSKTTTIWPKVLTSPTTTSSELSGLSTLVSAPSNNESSSPVDPIKSQLAPSAPSASSEATPKVSESKDEIENCIFVYSFASLNRSSGINDAAGQSSSTTTKLPPLVATHPTDNGGSRGSTESSTEPVPSSVISTTLSTTTTSTSTSTTLAPEPSSRSPAASQLIANKSSNAAGSFVVVVSTPTTPSGSDSRSENLTISSTATPEVEGFPTGSMATGVGGANKESVQKVSLAQNVSSGSSSDTLRPTPTPDSNEKNKNGHVNGSKLSEGVDSTTLEGGERELEDEANPRNSHPPMSAFSLSLNSSAGPKQQNQQQHQHNQHQAASSNRSTQTNSNTGHNNPGPVDLINSSQYRSSASPLSNQTHRMSPERHFFRPNSTTSTSMNRPATMSTSGTRNRFSSSHSIHEPASFHSNHTSSSHLHRAQSSGRAIHSRHTSTTTTTSATPTAVPNLILNTTQASSSSLNQSTAPVNQLRPQQTSSVSSSNVNHHGGSGQRTQQNNYQSLNHGPQLLTPNGQRSRSQSSRVKNGPKNRSDPGVNTNSSNKPVDSHVSSSTPTSNAISTSTTASNNAASTTTIEPKRMNDDDINTQLSGSTHRIRRARRITRYLANQEFGSDKVEILAYCKNIQNPQVLRDAIKGFRGHQVNYFVIDNCRLPPFPNDMFDGMDVKWLEMSNSTVQFHNNYLRPRHLKAIGAKR